MAWIAVRRRHKLLFRFDPEEDVIEIVSRGRVELVQLADYRPLANRLTAKNGCARLDINNAAGSPPVRSPGS
mgnify:CR=1 FL=1